MQEMNDILTFSLIIMRMSGCILFNPILGRRNIPGVVKTAIIFVLSIILITYQEHAVVEATTAIEYAVLLLKEFFCGFVIGTVVNLFLNIIIFGGEIIDFQMGLSMSKIYDMQSNTSLALSATFFNALFVLLFFVTDGHLVMLQLFLKSGELIPYGSMAITQSLSTIILDIFCDCMVLAVKLALPIMVVEILAEVGVGILMRTIPQINVFIINIQAKVILGIIFMVLLFSPMSEFLEGCIRLMFEALQQVMMLMK